MFNVILVTICVYNIIKKKKIQDPHTKKRRSKLCLIRDSTKFQGPIFFFKNLTQKDLFIFLNKRNPTLRR